MCLTTPLLSNGPLVTGIRFQSSLRGLRDPDNAAGRRPRRSYSFYMCVMRALYGSGLDADGHFPSQVRPPGGLSRRVHGLGSGGCGDFAHFWMW